MKWVKTLHLFVAMFFLFCTCQGEITQVDTMKEVMEYFKNAGVDTLGVFDIDMTLVQTKDPAFQMANMKRYSSIAKQISKSVPVDKKEIFLALMIINSEAILIEDETPCYLKELCCRGIPTIALTANLTGKLAHISHLETWKNNALKQVGIDFSCSSPYSDCLTFADLPSFRGNYSTFVNGILFANGYVCPKGDVLVRFLQMTALCPKQIIFIDDKEENVKSVEEALQKFDPTIEYIGLHYLGAKNYPSAFIDEKEFETRWKAIADLARETE